MKSNFKREYCPQNGWFLLIPKCPITLILQCRRRKNIGIESPLSFQLFAHRSLTTSGSEPRTDVPKLRMTAGYFCTKTWKVSVTFDLILHRIHTESHPGMVVDFSRRERTLSATAWLQFGEHSMLWNWNKVIYI